MTPYKLLVNSRDTGQFISDPNKTVNIQIGKPDDPNSRCVRFTLAEALSGSRPDIVVDETANTVNVSLGSVAPKAPTPKPVSPRPAESKPEAKIEPTTKPKPAPKKVAEPIEEEYDDEEEESTHNVLMWVIIAVVAVVAIVVLAFSLGILGGGKDSSVKPQTEVVDKGESAPRAQQVSAKEFNADGVFDSKASDEEEPDVIISENDPNYNDKIAMQFDARLKGLNITYDDLDNIERFCRGEGISDSLRADLLMRVNLLKQTRDVFRSSAGVEEYCDAVLTLAEMTAQTYPELSQMLWSRLDGDVYTSFANDKARRNFK